DPANPGIYLRELERMLGRPREHLEFTIWFLAQKKLINTDDARMYLTADGAEYLEESYRSNLHRKRLKERNDERPSLLCLRIRRSVGTSTGAWHPHIVIH